MSWMGFRTNLSRQQPRIIRVGEIAQLIILHAELAVAAVQEVSVWCSGCCWRQGEDELSDHGRLQWQSWPEGSRNNKPGPESLTLISISSASFTQNMRHHQLSVQKISVLSTKLRNFFLALYRSANTFGLLQDRVDQSMSGCLSSEFYQVVI